MESLWKDLSCNLKQASKAVLVQTENAGRGLIATENIQRDEVILTETPVISGPPQSIGPHFCANCSQPLTDGLLEGMFIITSIFARRDAELCRLCYKQTNTSIFFNTYFIL
jgi:hypothetical protein